MHVVADIISGHGVGRRLGYPTLNFSIPNNFSLEEGVFVCRVRWADDWLPGVAFFGRRETFDDDVRSFEVHVLDWAGGTIITQAEIEIIQKIRDPQKFASRYELIAAIAADCEAARKILAHTPDNL